LKLGIFEVLNTTD